MRSNPYSLEAIREIYDLENRKGMIDLDILPEEYRELVKLIHDKKSELSRLRSVSRKNMDEDAKAAHIASIETLKAEIKELGLCKEEKLHEILAEVETHINSSGYKFEIIRDDDYCSKSDKESFNLRGDSLENLIMAKLVCRDLVKSFKVKAANRHHIMTTLKGLLVTDKRFIIIRTDIENFFESIPHSVILSSLQENHFLSKRSKSIIINILHQLEQCSTKLPPSTGVPRGIGVSSYISEIVMREFDSYIKGMPNVMFYARYVDDIIVVLSHLEVDKSDVDFFNEMKSHIPLGLKFHALGSEKSTILNYIPEEGDKNEFSFLGYKIVLVPSTKQILFRLSDKRFERLKKRINRLFDYFTKSYKSNPRMAKKDLIDGVNLLSGNVNLHKSKSRIITGLYYSNALLSLDLSQMDDIQILFNDRVNQLCLEDTPFLSEDFKNRYLQSIQQKLYKVNFKDRWINKKTFSFSIARIHKLSNIWGK